MSKRVLVLSGSPRKGGNSDLLCDQFILKNKDIYFIVTATVSRKHALKRTIEGFRVSISVLDDVKESGIIYGAGACLEYG